MTKDQVFSEPRPQIVDFSFDEAVADVFPDMIRRSVPGYELVVPMTGLLAARHVLQHPEPLIYDLGCSLGATALAILHALDALAVEDPGLRIRAVDNAPAMLQRARTIVADPRVAFIEADVRHLKPDFCHVVTVNWVMQFLPPAERTDVLARIRDSLDPGGLLIISEKVHFDDPAADTFNKAVHLDFKRANGYSELEISQKRSALEQVMITDTIAEHLARLRAAGFQDAKLWFQCLNWASFMATA